MAEKLVHTGYGNGQSNFPLKLYVTYEITQDKTNNKSTISCGMYVTTPGSAWTIGPWTDYGSYLGTTSNTFTASIPNFGGSKTIVTGKTFTVKHNDDGTGKATIYWKWGVNSTWGGFTKPSGSFTIDLPTIPRYFSSMPKLEVISRTEETATIKWTTPEKASRVQYKFETGGWIDVEQDANATSGTYTITGLTPNKNYTIYGDFRKRDSELWTSTSPGCPSTNFTTYDVPHSTNTPNFTLEEGGVTFTFYNPLNRTFDFTVIGNGTQIGHTWGQGGGTSQLCLDGSGTQQMMYATIPNKQSATYTVKTIWTSSSGNKYERTNSSYGTFYANKSKSNPTFGTSNITNVVDTLHATDITGNSSKFIKGHNKLSASITAMTPKSSATGKKYTITANGSPSSQDKNYDSGATQSFTIENLTTNSFTVTAYDSREITTPVTKSVDLVDYSKPKISNFTVNRVNGLGEYAVVSAEGTLTYWSGWSGIKKYNTVQKAYLRYKSSTASSWGGWKEITSLLKTNANGSWKLSGTLEDVFTVTAKYDFQMYITDVLESSSTSSSQLSTANGFLWRDLANKRLGINKKPDEALDVNGNIQATGTITANSATLKKAVLEDTLEVANKVVYKGASGYTIDANGDWHHNSSDTSQRFIITDNNGNQKYKYNYETGLLELVKMLQIGGYDLVDAGTHPSGYGLYLKFSNGLMICARNSYQTTITTNTQWGGLYVGGSADFISYPQSFTTTPILLYDVLPTSSIGCFKVAYDAPNIQASGFTNIYVARSSNTSVPVRVQYIAVGWWK